LKKGQVFRVMKNGELYDSALLCDLPGWYQSENLATALALLDLLRERGYHLPSESVKAGISQVRVLSGLQGRMTVLGENPLIVADVGHNEAGIQIAMAQVLALPHENLFMVVGAVNDKDISKMLSFMPKHARYFFVKPNVPRGLDAGLLREAADSFGLHGLDYPTVMEGLSAAKTLATEQDLIFVGGSTFVVAEALPD
jgi:dihydrofolate synthase/folylpolyglutamate synthase